MATATAATYQGTFHGRAEELSRVRREVAGYLADCPASDELVLIADELAANCTPAPVASPSASAASCPPGPCG